MIAEFIGWLKGLSGGEGAFYATLFAAFLGGIGGLIRKLAKRNTPATSNMEPEQTRNDTPVKPPINIKKVEAKNGSIAIGVNIGGQVSQQGNQDGTK